MARELASLALAWMEQSGRLKVRQREELRRALQAAANVLSWGSVGGDRLEKATKDVVTLARNGTRALTRDLDAELEKKRGEMGQLDKAASALRALAEQAEEAYPTEFTYVHTARSPAEGLITKTQELTLADADEAIAAAENITKRTDAWDKLRREMLEELGDSQQSLVELKGCLKDFVESSKGLVQDVFAVMY